VKTTAFSRVSIGLGLLLAVLAQPLAAGEATRLIRGPWWWHDADGAPHIGIAVTGNPTLPAAADLDGKGVALVSSAQALDHDSDGASQVVVMRLPRLSTGTVRLSLGGQPVMVRVRPPPPSNVPARIILAGGRAWPDRAGIEALSRLIGGTPQLVLALGPNVPARLGSGGWEGEIPVVIAAPPDPGLSAACAGEDARWRNGLRVGVLGLPASTDRGRADLALARDLSPWLVYLDIPAGWDPAISQRLRNDPRDLAVLLAACQRLGVPLAIGAGAAGLVSEPLVMDNTGVVHAAADGVRYALPVPAQDDGLALLGPAVATPLEQPLLSALYADIGKLELVFLRPGDADGIRLAWRRGDDPGSGPGRGEAGPLAAAITAAETLDSPAVRSAIERWSWLPRTAIATPAATPDLVARLRDEAGPQGRMLARRLTVVAGDAPAAPVIPGEADPLAQRDLLLWRIATVRGADARGWHNLAAASTDAHVLRAVLADVARDPERELLPVLIERVQRQAAGELPLDGDPVDQHRLFAAVFDEVRLSPTRVRPWAVALRDKADPLARGPIDRFIARHGAERPVE
jgi:hypothetical protein